MITWTFLAELASSTDWQSTVQALLRKLQYRTEDWRNKNVLCLIVFLLSCILFSRTFKNVSRVICMDLRVHLLNHLGVTNEFEGLLAIPLLASTWGHIIEAVGIYGRRKRNWQKTAKTILADKCKRK